MSIQQNRATINVILTARFYVFLRCFQRFVYLLGEIRLELFDFG